jgi:hypothetical protein
MKGGKPFTNREVIDFVGVRCVSLPRTSISGGKIIKKLEKVASVIAQGVFADVALVTQVPTT